MFPWQLGFHRNNLAKDAISVKKSPTYTLLHRMHTNIETCSISGVRAAYLQLHAKAPPPAATAPSGGGGQTATPPPPPSAGTGALSPCPNFFRLGEGPISPHIVSLMVTDCLLGARSYLHTHPIYNPHRLTEADTTGLYLNSYLMYIWGGGMRV